MLDTKHDIPSDGSSHSSFAKPTIFTITPDAQNKKISHVHKQSQSQSQDQYQNASTTSSSTHPQALYTATSQARKPQVTLTDGATTQVLGTASFHKFTSFNTDVRYGDQDIVLRPSLKTGFHHFQYANASSAGTAIHQSAVSGLLEWRTESAGTREAELCNGKGTVLARVRDLKAVGKRETEVVVEGEFGEGFEGLVVLTAVALGVRSHLVVSSVGDAVGVSMVGNGSGDPT